MRRFNHLPILGLAILVVATSSVWAQNQYIGYVYPAGGQQGSTFPIRLGMSGVGGICTSMWAEPRAFVLIPGGKRGLAL